jgi:hypothetical protein
MVKRKKRDKIEDGQTRQWSKEKKGTNSKTDRQDNGQKKKRDKKINYDP